MSTTRSTTNAQNAQLSTGPRTPEGKAHSSQNALKHGLTAQTPILLPAESKDDYATFSAAYLAQLNPQTPIQASLAEHLIFLAWQLRRLPSAETKALDQYNISGLKKSDTPRPPAEILGCSFAYRDDKSNPLVRHRRYAATLERSFFRALAIYNQSQPSPNSELGTRNSELPPSPPPERPFIAA